MSADKAATSSGPKVQKPVEIKGMYTYKYYKDTGIGTLDLGTLNRGSGEVDIMVKNMRPSGILNLMKIPSIYFLKPLLYNESKNHMIYPIKGTQTITSWIENEVCFSSKQLKPLLTSNLYYTYMEPRVRKLVQGMIRFLYVFHSKGYSLNEEYELDEDSVRVCNDVPQFIGIDFCHGTKESRVKDFAVMRKLIIKLFPTHDGVLDDLLHTLQTLDGESEKGAYILTKNLSILQPDEVIQFIIRCDRIRPERMPQNEYEPLVDMMMGECEDWGSTIREAKHSWYGDTFQLFNYTTMKVDDSENPLNEHKIRNKHKISLLRFARNLAVHYKDHKDGSDRSKSYLELGPECAVLYFFKKEFDDLIRCMAQLNLLERYMDS